jgi:hypothetical protein
MRINPPTTPPAIGPAFEWDFSATAETGVEEEADAEDAEDADEEAVGPKVPVDSGESPAACAWDGSKVLPDITLKYAQCGTLVALGMSGRNIAA